MASIRGEKTAEEILRAETGDIRSLGRYEYYFVAAIAISWAIFQLALAGFLVLDSTKTRAIHLAFGMALLFLLYPCIKHSSRPMGFLTATDRIPFVDYILAAMKV